MRRVVASSVRCTARVRTLLAAGPAVLLPDVLRQLSSRRRHHLAESSRGRGIVRRLVQLRAAEPARGLLALLVWPRLGRDDVRLGGVLGD